MNELNEAWVLLFAGMATVFAMLLLVVLCAKLLIYLVNRFALPPAGPGNGPGIPEEELAALMAAVEIATQGQGRVEKVERE
jgi:Na+-transporting methylmalonyl-CoA/oxaloacetate decarboxylase gamma subunit